MAKAEKQIVIYEATGEVVQFALDQKDETIWATQAQIAEVFGVDRTVVGRHLRNIFKSGELEENRVCAKNAHTGPDGKVYQVKLYNLDAIISVGYRVNSAKATQFRIWANRVLKQYIVDGAAVNEGRLKELPAQKLKNLEGALGVVQRLLTENALSAGEAQGVLEVISKYAESFKTIEEFGQGRISFRSKGRASKGLTVEKCVQVAEKLREQLGADRRFGVLKGKELERGLARINESDWKLAERAAQLLYLVVCEKPFEDGNKRIGALLFIVYLTMNDYQLAGNGEVKISDRALTALTLLLAESEPGEKELLIALVCKMLEN